jgi:hypothetical protein
MREPDMSEFFERQVSPRPTDWPGLDEYQIPDHRQFVGRVDAVNAPVISADRHEIVISHITTYPDGLFVHVCARGPDRAEAVPLSRQFLDGSIAFGVEYDSGRGGATTDGEYWRRPDATVGTGGVIVVYVGGVGGPVSWDGRFWVSPAMNEAVSLILHWRGVGHGMVLVHPEKTR